jgi:hypothetical protein
MISVRSVDTPVVPTEGGEGRKALDPDGASYGGGIVTLRVGRSRDRPSKSCPGFRRHVVGGACQIRTDLTRLPRTSWSLDPAPTPRLLQRSRRPRA